MNKFNISRFLLILVLCAAFMCISAFAAGVVYVADGGEGNGSSAATPVATLTDAYDILGDEGGTVVVCGAYTLSTQFIEPEHSGKVTVTSKYGKTDYAKENGAVIEFYDNYYLTGETEFKNIVLRGMASFKSIMARANTLTIGEGIVSEKGEEANYISVVGGSSALYKNKTGNITINSGIWQRVRGGTLKAGSVNYNVNITINGGEFKESVVLSSAAASAACSHNGNVNAVINGGCFYSSVYLTAYKFDTDEFNGNAALTINGGMFYQDIALSSTSLGVHHGTFDVVLNGGEYHSLHKLDGGCTLAGDIVTSLTYGGEVDITAAENDKITFTNYFRRNADPFMFYHDGFYYYTSTGATTIALIKVRNISDVKYATPTAILAPENHTDLWSPEIHYFSAEEVGEKDAGWYMFVGAKEKGAEGSVASNQRQYVVKCLDGDNLLGRWGDPVTGEVNVLRKMTFTNGGYNEDELCGGSSPIRINGKVYLTFISEKGRGTSSFHQTVNITTFETPWNITGTPVEICRPDYDWEKHGYASKEEEGVIKWWPQVVEGASAVYAPTGEVYLMYTGSGYWTTWYALGYLKFMGGNPLDKANWAKNPTPVLQREQTLNETSVNGCGHGSYFTDRDGQMWVAYHGYIGVDTTSKRFSHLEPIYVTADGVSIGNGSGNPAPLDTVYTINADPTPIFEKTSGFNKIKENVTSDIDSGVKINFGPVDGATAYNVYRDGENGTLVYEGGTPLPFVDSAATPGSHVYYIEAVKFENGEKVVLSSTETIAVARNNLKFKDVNSDGDFNISDILNVLRNFLDGNLQDATFVDVVQMLRCI